MMRSTIINRPSSVEPGCYTESRAVQNPEPRPLVVTLIPATPARQTTVADVVVGALGITGVLVLIALLAGGVLAVLRVRWNRRHPPENDHLPPVAPVVKIGDGHHPSSPVR